MAARGRTDGTSPQSAPAAHTIEVEWAPDGVLLRHKDCGGTWSVDLGTVVPATMLDLIHTVVDHVCER